MNGTERDFAWAQRLLEEASSRMGWGLGTPLRPITWKRMDLSKASSDWPQALSCFVLTPLSSPGPLVPLFPVSWSGPRKALGQATQGKLCSVQSFSHISQGNVV